MHTICYTFDGDFMVCNLCPRHCNAVRNDFDGNGFCKMGNLAKIARIAPHFDEEPCISGTKGSGTVFFSGCSLQCVFCQNFDISTKNQGKIITTDELVNEIKKLEDQGVHNINFVSPTPYVNVIIEALSKYKPNIPIVYNTSGYEKIETLNRLKGFIDIYLPDFKYSNNKLALDYSKAKDYVEVTVAAIQEMVNQTGTISYDSNNIMKKGTIVRHLVLPNHTNNSIGVLDLLKNIEGDFLVSLMAQYTPLGNAHKYPKLNRKISQREYDKVKNYMFNTEFDGFIQELNSADKKYVPDWNY